MMAKAFSLYTSSFNLSEISLLRLVEQKLRSSPGERQDGQRGVFVGISDKTRAIRHEQVLHVVGLAEPIQG